MKQRLRKQWTLAERLISRHCSGDPFPNQGQRARAASCCLALHFGSSGCGSFPALAPNHIHFGGCHQGTGQPCRCYGKRQGQERGGGRTRRFCDSQSHDRHACLTVGDTVKQFTESDSVSALSHHYTSESLERDFPKSHAQVDHFQLATLSHCHPLGYFCSGHT